MATILSVDDSEPMRMLVNIVLTKAGHTVVNSDNGADAFSLFCSQKFDLVLTDINMQKMNGFELVEAIRRIGSVTPILILTTETNSILRKRGDSSGANGWVLKPFKPAALADMVRNAL